MSVTNWLTDELVENWMNWPKYADNADYADYADYADIADYAHYAEYAEYSEHAEYAKYAENAKYVCFKVSKFPVVIVWVSNTKMCLNAYAWSSNRTRGWIYNPPMRGRWRGRN